MPTIPNRKSPPAILLRQAYRENGKVKNRTLANLSGWDPARIEALRRALRGEFDHATLSEPTLGSVFGLLYTLKQIADVLGLTAALGNTALGKLALFLVLVRLPHQGSRLSAVRWAQDHAVREVLSLDSFDEDDLYAALDETALHHRADRSPDPWVARKILQLELFSEQLCEVEDHGVRYVLRKTETEAARERHRLEDKLAKLEEKIAVRNEETKKKQRCQPEAEKRKLEAWAAQHKLNGLVTVKLEGRLLGLEHQKARSPRLWNWRAATW